MQTVDAVYESGIFRPLNPIPLWLQEGQKVEVIITPEQASDDVLALATSVFDGLSEEEANNINSIIDRRTQRGSWNAALRILDQVPDAEPDAHDRG